MPLIDFAYQGFADGLEQDAAGVRALAESAREFIVCSSFSKNFGLYNERVGAMTIVADSASVVGAVLSQAKMCVRRCYSNPPAHGGAIVVAIANDATLRAQWEKELADIKRSLEELL